MVDLGSKSFLGRIQSFYLPRGRLFDSLAVVKQTAVVKKRDRLAASLPDARDVLRGSLLQRVIRHRSGCPKCDRGEGHPVAVLAVGYPGRRIRQICLRKEQVPGVRRSLAKYQELKAAIEQICEMNLELLREDPREEEGKRGK